MTSETKPPRPPSAIMSDIVARSRLIANLRHKFDTKSHSDPVASALALQRAKRERAEFQRELPPLRLIDCTTEQAE